MLGLGATTSLIVTAVRPGEIFEDTLPVENPAAVPGIGVGCWAFSRRRDRSVRRLCARSCRAVPGREVWSGAPVVPLVRRRGLSPPGLVPDAAPRAARSPDGRCGGAHRSRDRRNRGLGRGRCAPLPSLRDRPDRHSHTRLRDADRDSRRARTSGSCLRDRRCSQPSREARTSQSPRRHSSWPHCSSPSAHAFSTSSTAASTGAATTRSARSRPSGRGYANRSTSAR